MVLASPQRAAALWTNPVCEMKLYKMLWEPWSFDRRGTIAPSASLKEHLFSEDHLVQVFSKQKSLYSRITFRLFWLEKVHGPSVHPIKVLTIKGVEFEPVSKLKLKTTYYVLLIPAPILAANRNLVFKAGTEWTWHNVTSVKPAVGPGHVLGTAGLLPCHPTPAGLLQTRSA